MTTRVLVQAHCSAGVEVLVCRSDRAEPVVLHDGQSHYVLCHGDVIVSVHERPIAGTEESGSAS